MLPGPNSHFAETVQVFTGVGLKSRFGLEIRSLLVDSKLTEVDCRHFADAGPSTRFKFDVEKTFFEV